MVYREKVPHPMLSRVIRMYQVFSKDDDDNPIFSHDMLMPEPGAVLALMIQGEWILSKHEKEDGTASAGRIVVSAGLQQPLAVTLNGYSYAVFVRFLPGGPENLNLFSAAQTRSVISLTESWADELYSMVSDDCIAGIPAVFSLLDSFFLARAAAAGNAVPHRVLQAMNYAVHHPHTVTRLEDIASECGMCTRTYERAFFSLTGYSPREYRLIRACEAARSILFIDDDISLTAAALSLGFYDLPHLCGVFKRWSGVSPGAFRQVCRNFKQHMTGENTMKGYHQLCLY